MHLDSSVAQEVDLVAAESREALELTAALASVRKLQGLGSTYVAVSGEMSHSTLVGPLSYVPLMLTATVPRCQGPCRRRTAAPLESETL